MRSVFGQGVIVGVGVGAAAVIIRAMFSAAPLHVQLLAVLGAGCVLAGIQFTLSRRLARPKRLPASREPASRPPAAPPTLHPSHTAPIDRDTGWTGLAVAPSLPAPLPPGERLAEPRAAAQDAEPPR